MLETSWPKWDSKSRVLVLEISVCYNNYLGTIQHPETGASILQTSPKREAVAALVAQLSRHGPIHCRGPREPEKPLGGRFLGVKCHRTVSRSVL